jgi:hypothetical protein
MGKLKSSPFWDVTQRLLIVTDVSGELNGRIVKGQGSSLKIGPMGCPETSVSNQRCVKTTEEQRPHLHRGGSLKTHKKATHFPQPFL